MAVVKDYYSGNTHIRIHDDAYAHLTPEEIAARHRQIQEHANQIVRKKLLQQQREDSA